LVIFVVINCIVRTLHERGKANEKARESSGGDSLLRVVASGSSARRGKVGRKDEDTRRKTLKDVTVAGCLVAVGAVAAIFESEEEKKRGGCGDEESLPMVTKKKKETHRETRTSTF